LPTTGLPDSHGLNKPSAILFGNAVRAAGLQGVSDTPHQKSLGSILSCRRDIISSFPIISKHI
jgi:hypothetical protein